MQTDKRMGVKGYQTDETCYQTFHTFKNSVSLISLVENLNRSDFKISTETGISLVTMKVFF